MINMVNGDHGILLLSVFTLLDICLKRKNQISHEFGTIGDETIEEEGYIISRNTEQIKNKEAAMDTIMAICLVWLWKLLLLRIELQSFVWSLLL